MKRVIVGFLVVSFSLLIKSCDTTDPPDNKSLNLKLEDVSCTEAWITLTTANLQLPVNVILKQNDQTRSTINLVKVDTLLYIDSLLPNKSYQYQVSSIEYQVSSNALNVTTMDTTSHNFSFETFTFGDISNSVLFDVAIISQENIWCVGEINIADTSINGYTTYNAVHWDGNQWEFKRILYQGSFWTIRTIFAFNENDVWFSAFVRYDGQNFIELPIPPILMGWTINKIWGSSSNDLYAVGDNGNIAHYENSSWRKITSGTDVHLLDVWGTQDGKIVWACGETIYKTVLVKIGNNVANIVFEGTYPMPQIKNRFSDGLLSLWTNKNNFIYILSPYNLYRCEVTTTGEGQELYPYDDYFKGAYVRLRGIGVNDLCTSGNKSTITHFNGINWKIYDELRDEDQRLVGLDVIENLLLAVGEKFENTFYYKAIIIVGRR